MKKYNYKIITYNMYITKDKFLLKFRKCLGYK